MLCYSICIGLISVRYRYVVDFDDCIINRCMHTLTLEGDSEKPSCQKHEGPFRIPSSFSTLSEDVGTNGLMGVDVEWLFVKTISS